MGTSHQKDQTWTRSLDLSSPSPTTCGKGRGLKIELIINQAYMTRSPWNLLNDRVWQALGWWTHRGAERVACWERAWTLPDTFPILCPMHLLQLAISEFHPLQYTNKLIKALSWVPGTIVANYWTWRGVMGKPICSHLVRRAEGSGLATVVWISELSWTFGHTNVVWRTGGLVFGIRKHYRVGKALL